MKTTLASAVLLALAAQASAIAVYTDEASFLGQLRLGFYMEDFESLTPDTNPSSLAFSGGVYSYTASASESPPGNFGGLYVNAPGSDPARSIALTVYNSGAEILFDFSAGTQPTAIGANFYASTLDTAPVQGQIVVKLNSGTTFETTITSANASTFTGFTSWNDPISSMSIHVSDVINWPTVDNLVVGAAVPDGGTTLVLLGGALTGIGVLRRRFRG